jgi:hypothetical protein
VAAARHRPSVDDQIVHLVEQGGAALGDKS